MQLIYCYIKNFRNIVCQEINFSENYNVHYKEDTLYIDYGQPNQAADYLYGQSFMRNLRVIVGKTGSGKTNLLQLLGMNEYERLNSLEKDAYLMLYQMADKNSFLMECVGIDVKGITDQCSEYLPSRKRYGVYKFVFFPEHKVVEYVTQLYTDDNETTCVVNAFDRYAFAHCPYEELREEGYGSNFLRGFIPRKAVQYGKSFAALECECLKEYLSLFEEDNIKRKAAWVVRWDNWQYTLKNELDEKLLAKDYWTYKDRAYEQRMRNIREGKSSEIKYPAGSTPKSRFIHDLMTDFAIYLRKWADCIDISLSEMSDPINCDKGIYFEYLPDYEKLGILKRINWLCQYLDYYTDPIFRNKGLIWQAGQDVIDLFGLMDQLDEKYFTDEELSIPIMEIDSVEGSPIQQIFERIGQYRPDEVGVFTKELLPYHWSCISSGEYQYAKIWGILEEYAVRSKIMKQGEGFNQAVFPNLIVLLDEPETYMHPELCRQFINRMSSVVQRRYPKAHFQVILTTHSPFMLSDLLSHQVIRMDVDKQGYCRIMQDSERSYFAANIHTILSDGFFLQFTIGEQARTFLTRKLLKLREVAEEGRGIHRMEREEIEKMRAFLPYIGDEMIRNSFKQILYSCYDKIGNQPD